MGSNYNSRPKPAEILVSKDKYTVIRKAESFEDLIKLENLVTTVHSMEALGNKFVLIDAISQKVDPERN